MRRAMALATPKTDAGPATSSSPQPSKANKVILRVFVIGKKKHIIVISARAKFGYSRCSFPASRTDMKGHATAPTPGRHLLSHRNGVVGCHVPGDDRRAGTHRSLHLHLVALSDRRCSVLGGLNFRGRMERCPLQRRAHARRLAIRNRGLCRFQLPDVRWPEDDWKGRRTG